MLEVAEAFQYLHSEGMVHGDLHGVCDSVSYLPEFNQVISLSIREMSFSILDSTARLLTLG